MKRKGEESSDRLVPDRNQAQEEQNKEEQSSSFSYREKSCCSLSIADKLQWCEENGIFEGR